MGEERQMYQEMVGLRDNMKDLEASSISSSACLSLTTSDLTDDASSTYSPLYELSELMAQLPIKRGLSKYYNGKSQTFASLASLRSVEDLAKKDDNRTYSQRMKSCKSYGGCSLNHQQHKFGPKATIKKKHPKVTFSFSPAAKSTMLVNL